MAAGILIRAYEDQDRDAVLALFRTVNAELAPPGMETAFADYVEQSIATEMGRIPEIFQSVPGSGFWVAMAGRDLAGMVGIERHSHEEAELRRMYVDPGRRRQGIGNRLLDHIEAFCRDRGYARLILSTSEVQGAALATYQARGYDLVREEVAEAQSTKTIGGGVRRFHFAKELAID